MIALAKLPPFLTACIAFIFGAIGVLAYAPFDFWFLAYLSAFGFIWFATALTRKRALWATFAWSMGYFGVGLSWVQVSMTQFGGVPEAVGYIAVALLAAYLALYNLIFVYLVHRFNQRHPFVLAGLFTFTEYLRGVVFTGFPWLQFGYSQIDSPFLGLAPIFGVEGLTFFVISVSAFFAYFIHQPYSAKAFRLPFLTVSLLLLAGFSSQYLTFVHEDTKTNAPKISLVQGNIEQKMKWDPDYFNDTIQRYQRLIAPLLGKSEVIILPESAFPTLESDIEPLLQQLNHAAAQHGSEIIIGTLYRAPTGALFNSALTLGNTQAPYTPGTPLRYNKHHLVPFGEYVPFGNLLSWMREIFILPINLSQGDFIQTPLSAKNLQFNLAICYEIIFGKQVQQNQKTHHSDYLLTISNDAWFGTSIGPHQHFQMARMRALELGKPLIRATNTGITAFVDYRGKVLAQAPQFEATTLSYAIPKTTGQTPFAQIGVWLIYLLSKLAVVIGFIYERKKWR